MLALSEKGHADGGLVIRTARKAWRCEGNGAARPTVALGCWGEIPPASRYLECLWEAPPFSSGSRHCPPCALRYFSDWVEEGGSDHAQG